MPRQPFIEVIKEWKMKQLLMFVTMALGFGFAPIHAEEAQKSAPSSVRDLYNYDEEGKTAASLLLKVKTNFASCEDACYKTRSRCMDQNGNSHKCDPAFDSCMKGCK
jgi:RecB family endonuclease NucS